MSRTVAMEALMNPGILHHRIASMEELEVIASDGVQEGYAAVNELEAADREYEIATGLSDLSVITDQIVDPSPINTALVQAAAQLAVAGTSVEPDALIPSMESGDTTFGEGLRARAKAIVEQILATLRTIYERFMKWVRGVYADAQRLDNALAKLETDIEEMEADKPPVGSAEILVRSAVSMLNYGEVSVKTMHSAKELQSVLESSAKVGEFIFGQHTKYVLAKASSLAKIIEDFKSDNTDESIAKAVKEMRSLSTSKLPGETKLGDYLPNYDSYGSDVMMGGKMVVRSVYAPRAGDDVPAVSELERVARAQMTVIAGESAKRFKEGEYKFQTMNPKEMLGVVKAARAICSLLIVYANGEVGARKLDAARKELETASKRIPEFESSGADNDVSPQVAWDSLVRLNLDFANWTFKPHQALNEHLLASVRFATMLVRSSLNEYR